MRPPRLPTVLILLVATALLMPLPGGALADAPSTDVTIVVEAPQKLLATHEPFTWTLTLTWAEADALNATGAPTALDLLDHIASTNEATYSVDWFDTTGDGTADAAFVDEIDGVASDFTLILVGTFWALYHNDESSGDAANQLTAAPGDSVRYTYTGWPVDL